MGGRRFGGGSIVPSTISSAIDWGGGVSDAYPMNQGGGKTDASACLPQSLEGARGLLRTNRGEGRPGGLERPRGGAKGGGGGARERGVVPREKWACHGPVMFLGLY